MLSLTSLSRSRDDRTNDGGFVAASRVHEWAISTEANELANGGQGGGLLTVRQARQVSNDYEPAGDSTALDELSALCKQLSADAFRAYPEALQIPHEHFTAVRAAAREGAASN